MLARDAHIVIVGGGFAGLRVAQGLRHAPVKVTLIDRRNFHLFQPLLYQVATGVLSPANIATPLRLLFKGDHRIQVLMGDVTDIDVENKMLTLDGGYLGYDVLVVASGSTHQYFGHDEWRSFAPGLKTVEDALNIRARIFGAFEAAEREPDPERMRALLTFVIVGAGPTGVELAGAVREIANHTLYDEFRKIDPSDAQIVLIERGPRVLHMYPEHLSEKAEASLRRLGVQVRTNTNLDHAEEGCLTVSEHGTSARLPANTVIWTAGVKASPLGKLLADKSGAALDHAGRVAVGPDLTLPGHPEIFVIGDLALSKGEDGRPVPGVAPAAIQEGAYVARALMRRLRGKETPPFRYIDLGSMATIGRGTAVAFRNRFSISGYIAWLAWLFTHLLKLVRFQNRFLVLVQWGWNYVTRSRAARIITRQAPDVPEDPAG